MLNHVVIMGRLTRDPELRYTNNEKPVASFTVAVERDYNPQGGSRETDFIDCTAWNSTAVFVDGHFQKGSMICVKGRLQSRNWTDREGKKRTSWELVADSVYFCEVKREQRAVDAGPNAFAGLTDVDGDLPF